MLFACLAGTKDELLRADITMTATLLLKVQRSETVECDEQKVLTPRIEGIDENGKSVPRFDLMCAKIDSDIRFLNDPDRKPIEIDFPEH